MLYIYKDYIYIYIYICREREREREGEIKKHYNTVKRTLVQDKDVPSHHFFATSYWLQYQYN